MRRVFRSTLSVGENLFHRHASGAWKLEPEKACDRRRDIEIADVPDTDSLANTHAGRDKRRIHARMLGHLFLRLSGHRDDGLMRPSFSHRSLTARGNRAFRLSDKDLKKMRAALERTKRSLDLSPSGERSARVSEPGEGRGADAFMPSTSPPMEPLSHLHELVPLFDRQRLGETSERFGKLATLLRKHHLVQRDPLDFLPVDDDLAELRVERVPVRSMLFRKRNEFQNRLGHDSLYLRLLFFARVNARQNEASRKLGALGYSGREKKSVSRRTVCPGTVDFKKKIHFLLEETR